MELVGYKNENFEKKKKSQTMVFLDEQSWKEAAPAWPRDAWDFSDYGETGTFQVLSQSLASLTVIDCPSERGLAALWLLGKSSECLGSSVFYQTKG